MFVVMLSQKGLCINLPTDIATYYKKNQVFYISHYNLLGLSLLFRIFVR
jgi:hypothetical protein